MFTNRMPRFEPLSDDALDTIERGVDRLAAEVGVQFDHPDAIEHFRNAGQTVVDQTVHFDPGFLRAQAALAPSTFSLRARVPARSLEVGGDAMLFGAVNGPPFVLRDGVRRDGTMADAEDLLRLVQVTDLIDTPGRNMLEPGDVPLDVRHLVRALAAIRMTDRVWAGEASSDVAAEDCLRMAEIVFGGADAIADEPVIFANCNVNSPLLFDSRMLEGILTYAAAGQAVIITPFLLMGAMAPVSVPAALVQQTVEALAGVALVQLDPPGHPVRDGLVPLDHRHEDRLADVRRARVGGRAARLGPDRTAHRPAVARRRRHAQREPGDRLPGRLRVDEHPAGRLPGRCERRLAVRGLARGRAGDVARQVRRGRRADRPPAGAVHAARGRRGEPRARRARRGGPRWSLLRRPAHARALPRVLLAPDRRDDREHRPLDAGRPARPRRPGRAPGGRAARDLRGAGRSTTRSRTS